MSQVLPAEGGLRRVIGDGETLPDGEIDGLGSDGLLALYRNLVLLTGRVTLRGWELRRRGGRVHPRPNRR